MTARFWRLAASVSGVCHVAAAVPLGTEFVATWRPLFGAACLLCVAWAYVLLRQAVLLREEEE